MKLTKEQKAELLAQKKEDKKDLSNWNKNMRRLKKIGAIISIS